MKKQQNNNLDELRHSCAHLLAAAVMDLYPKALLTIGPSIEEGFYYDIDFGKEKITEADLPKIEARMYQIAGTWEEFVKEEVSKDKALKMYDKNPYKKELIKEFTKEGQKITLYHSGKFTDLCRGGHTENPNKVLKYFKLTSVAGAYWRGNEKNPMLTRIYGTAFFSQEELDSHLNAKEEAKRRDHKKLGRDLDLFTFSEYVGSGLPLYTQRGAFVRMQINKYIEDLQSKENYMQVWTPQIAKAELFKKSGHYDKYKKDMFKVISNYSKDEFYLKPMNCPQHTQIYASKPRSYRDLPIRMTDFAMLYRDERPGELNGLARARSFSQDDCHVFCTEEQVDHEIDMALSMTKQVMETFGFKYRYRLSTRDPKKPKKYLGDPKIWNKVEKWAEKIMKRNKIEYYEGPGEAAFYAPKMDLMATDALNREWQLSTVQIDYVQPERFGLKYTDKNGKEKTPIMIHRAIVGSSERFMMVLLEHLAGSLPVWLSPTQIKILPITDKHHKYVEEVNEELKANGIRVEIDLRSEKLGAKIRDAQMEKIPYMAIIGDKEVEAKKIAIRLRSGEDLGQLSVKAFIDRIEKKISEKSLDM